MKTIILILILMSSLFAHENLEEVSLQLKWKYQFQFAGFIAAKEKGFYKEEGIDVNLLEYDESIDTLEEMQKGEIQFAVSDSALILEAMKGIPVVAMMAIYQKSPYILMGLKSSNINNLEDINGKKLAIYDDINGKAIKSILKAHNIKFIQKSVNNKLTKLQNRQVDVVIAYMSNEPYVAREMGMDLTLIDPNDYGFERYGDILFTSKEIVQKRPELVDKIYRASQRGFEYAFTHIDEMVELIYHKYNTLNKSKEALRYEANILKKLSGYDDNFGEISREKVESIAYIYSMLEFGKYDLDNLDDFIYKKNRSQTQLTQEELAYLKNKKIRVCVHPDLYPLEVIKDGKHKGISADFMQLLTKEYPFNFELILAKNDEEVFRNVFASKCDLKTTVLHQYNLVSEYMNETNIIATDTLVLITKNNKPFTENISFLEGKKIAVISNAIKDFIKNKYPLLEIIVIPNIETVIDQLRDDEIYGLIDLSLHANTIVQKYGFNTLKVNTKLSPHIIKGVIGISKKEPQLLTIMNKLLKIVPKNEIDNIKTRWSIQTYHQITDYGLVWKIIGAFLLIILIISIVYFKQRQLKQSIEQEKNKFKNIFDKATDGILILTNGVFTDCNDAVINMLQSKTRHDILNLTPSQLSPILQPDGENSLEKSKQMMKIAAEQGSTNFQWKHLKADGSEFWVDITLTDISKDDDKILHAVWRDISKKKKLEDEIININKSLEIKVEEEIEKNKQHELIMLQQSRYAQMGEMISMIAHQWRQPLNNLSMIIQGASLKYKLGKFNDEIMMKLSQDSQKQIMQMSQTIDDFRYFFKPNKHAKVFNVKTSILHTLTLLKSIFDQHLIVVETHLEDNISIKGFSNEIGQVLINILNNAKDALVEKNSDKKKIITVVLKKEDDSVVITIEDNAGGIADDIINKIFDPYFSTKEEKNGTGLGLYMSKSIIEEHCHGTLSVENSRNGAIFKIVMSGSHHE